MSAICKFDTLRRIDPTMNGARPPPAVIQTPGFAHYGLAWSPFHTTRLALASAANFGLVGNGRLHLLALNPAGGIQLEKQYVPFRLLFRKAIDGSAGIG